MTQALGEFLDQAAGLCGGSDTKLAKACGVSQNTVWAARRAGRVSAELAKKIDVVTAGAVPRWKLRPDLWDVPVEAVSA